MATVTLFYGVGLYANRIIGEDLSKAESHVSFKNINFIQGNGIDASLTINNPPSVNDSPSYLTVDYEDSTPLQLWFVISCFKQNAKQITLTLRRDFLTEDWDILRKLPFLCEKSATIPDSCSDAQYKKTMNLSQVKKKEILLKRYSDPDGMKGWFVFYISKPSGAGQDDPLKGKTIIGSDATKTISFPSTFSVSLTTDSVYGVFAIPVGGPVTLLRSNGSNLVSNMDVSLVYNIAASMATQLGSQIYDVQYLPYITKSVFREDSGTAIISSNSQEVGFGTMLSTTKGTISLQYIGNKGLSDLKDDFDSQTTYLLRREYEEKHMFRLSSPNYQSSFEFSLVRNGSAFPTFQADIALKPFTPYIYIYPSFSRLYGSVFNDGRGLILSGDFSIDRVDSAWANYQLSNKNYEAVFNRQIQTMDLKNSIAMKESNWNIAGSYVGALSGTAGGAAAGAMAGTMIAPGIGTAVGAIAGGVSSLAGGVADVVHSHAQKAYAREINDDARDNAIQQFQYQIGNIQAIPNTLTKISAINPNYKVYPVLEVYECTDQESKNLENAIRYNGIDINIVCTLGDFSKGYVQGSILHFPPELHISQEQALVINEALQSGRYIKEV